MYPAPNDFTNSLKGHSALRNWLNDHPDAAAAIQADPRAALGQERHTELREEESRPPAERLSERDLRSFEDYLDTHDETA